MADKNRNMYGDYHMFFYITVSSYGRVFGIYSYIVIGPPFFLELQTVVANVVQRY
jgi:hypothetical protein